MQPFIVLFVSLLGMPPLFGGARPGHDERPDRIAEKLIAPCCWSETVRVHHSPKADELRAGIAQKLAAGQSEKQIVEGYVAEYGERILVTPEGSKKSVLFVLPVAIALAGLGGLVWYLRRPKLAVAGGPVAALPAEFEGEDLP